MGPLFIRLDIMHGFSLCSHRCVGLDRSSMAGTKPVSKGYIWFSIIALEVAMVQLMEIRATGHIDLFIDDNFFKPDVALGRC